MALDLSESVRKQAIEKLGEVKTMLQKEGVDPVEGIQELAFGSGGKEEPRSAGPKIALIIAKTKAKMGR